jgi:hypothetical protein
MHPQPPDVEHRGHGHGHVAAVQALVGTQHVDGVPQQVVVGQDGALRAAGGARGVHDERGVAAVDVAVERLGGTAGEQVGVGDLAGGRGAPGPDRVADPDPRLGQRADRRRRERLVKDEHAGAGAGEDVADLRAGEPEVDRDGDGADLRVAE